MNVRRPVTYAADMNLAELQSCRVALFSKANQPNVHPAAVALIDRTAKYRRNMRQPIFRAFLPYSILLCCY